MTELVPLPYAPIGDNSADAQLWNATLGWLRHQASANTRVAYQRGLLGIGVNGKPVIMKAPAWIPWCRLHQLQPLDARLRHVDEYSDDLAAGGFALRSIGQRLAIVSSWYTYLMREDLADRNPAAAAKRPNVRPEDSPTGSLSEDELNRFLDAAKADGPRTAAFMNILYFGALRLGSAIDADIGDLGWYQGKRQLRHRVKGGHVRYKVLEDQAAAALAAYLTTRPGALPDEPLFAADAGERLDDSYVWRLTRRLARAADIPAADQMSPHWIKATHITHAFDERVDSAIIQSTADHAHPQTTLAYDKKRHGRQFRSGTALSDRRAAYLAVQAATEPEGQPT